MPVEYTRIPAHSTVTTADADAANARGCHGWRCSLSCCLEAACLDQRILDCMLTYGWLEFDLHVAGSLCLR